MSEGGESGAEKVWYVGLGGKRQGPYTAEELRGMIAGGRVPRGAPVWKSGMPEWVPWGNVVEFAGVAPPQVPFQQYAPGGPIADFLVFRRMVTPIIIQILFWIGVVAVVVIGLSMLGRGIASDELIGVFGGLLIVVLGVLYLRVCCEITIIFFRMNETLTDIKKSLERP